MNACELPLILHLGAKKGSDGELSHRNVDDVPVRSLRLLGDFQGRDQPELFWREDATRNFELKSCDVDHGRSPTVTY